MDRIESTANPLPASFAVVPVSPEPTRLLIPLPIIPRPTPVDPPANDLPIIYLVRPRRFRRLFEGSLVFLCVVLFLRTMAVEPFGVPTGSMAPTLIGNHKKGLCPRCGYTVLVGDPGQNVTPEELRRAYADACCPNCRQGKLDLHKSVEVPGDRLLVDKTLFQIRKPQRWEPAVFRCPVDLSKPYVKRVVGLPGERILIKQGDVYINDAPARKSLTQAREMKVVIFDQDFAPPSGWQVRWVPPLDDLPRDRPHPASHPTTHPLRGSDLHLIPEGDRPLWLTYRNWLIDEQKEEALYDRFEYNGTPPRRRTASYAVHDFLIECRVSQVQGCGTLSLQLTDGCDTVTLELGLGRSGESHLIVEPRTASQPIAWRLVGGATASAQIGSGRQVVRSAVVPQQPQADIRIFFAFVDRRILCAINEREPFGSYDLPPVAKRGRVSRPVQIGIAGASAVLSNLRISRDFYYTPHGKGPGEQAVRAPGLQIGEGEYFLLGDNSANSDDCRYWAIPTVPEDYFIGKPFLLHQPSKNVIFEMAGRASNLTIIDWDRVRHLR